MLEHRRIQSEPHDDDHTEPIDTSGIPERPVVSPPGPQRIKSEPNEDQNECNCLECLEEALVKGEPGDEEDEGGVNSDTELDQQAVKLEQNSDHDHREDINKPDQDDDDDQSSVWSVHTP